jgi:hypothetical protein
VGQQTTTKGGARDVKQAFSVECRHRWPNVFPRITSKPLSASGQPNCHGKQIRNIRPKAAILSGSRTLSRPASSPQVIENKNTIEMNEIREAKTKENVLQTWHIMTFPDIL